MANPIQALPIRPAFGEQDAGEPVPVGSRRSASGTTWRDLLREGISTLSSAGIPNAGREAMWLMQGALRAGRLEIWFHGDRVVNTDQRDQVQALFARRAAREPLQYLLGTQEFCGLEFIVQPGVLIPRPETELLVHELLRAPVPSSAPMIADIGTGSGCLAVSFAWALPEARLYATDQSAVALDVAQQNAARHGVGDRIVFLAGDLLAPLRGRGLERKLTAVVSNPPYIPDGELDWLPPEVGRFEPRLALAGGEDGLDLHRRLLEEACEFLTPGGWLVLEVGLGQANRLRRIALDRGGYDPVRVVPDAAGIKRVVCLQRPGA